MKKSKLEKAFSQYNKKYFQGKLLNPPKSKVCWAELGPLGVQEGNVIYMNKKYRTTDSIWRPTLLHEMVHMYMPKNVWHGPRFQKEMLRLAKAGAFNGLW